MGYMEKKDFQKEFINLLQKKFPKKTELANFVADSLYVEKDSAYRRLRGEVQFSLQEACLLAKKLSVSLDEIVNQVDNKTKTLNYKIMDSLHLDYEGVKEYHTILREIAEDPLSVTALTAKTLPTTFCVEHVALRKFYLLQWIYQYGEKKTIPKLDNIEQIDMFGKLIKKEAELNNSISAISYIFHEHLFLRLVQDIKYFVDLKVLDSAFIKALIYELLQILDQIENLAAAGYNKERSKVNIYVSSMNFDIPIQYIYSTKYQLTTIMPFVVNGIQTFDQFTFDWARKYVQSFKRTSVYMTECGDVQRQVHINKQREIVESLSELF